MTPPECNCILSTDTLLNDPPECNCIAFVKRTEVNVANIEFNLSRFLPTCVYMCVYVCVYV